jgi:TRAP-type mannitol/chloroaromatic compound transport system permease large subunit
MAEDLLDTIGQVFGPVRGGLAYAVVFVGALLAATTGVVAASVISMGLISLPIMLRYGYDRRVATGVIAASGTLAQIIPPSLVLIVMADQLGARSATIRCVRPCLGGALCGVRISDSMLYPNAAPALPPEARTLREPNGQAGYPSLAIVVVASSVAAYLIMRQTDVKAGADFVVLAMSVGVGLSFAVAVLNRMLGLGLLSRLAEQAVFVMVPPLALIFLVLGTIFIGVATPTEAAPWARPERCCSPSRSGG